jgi:outer membrane protein OmpA-like peptidoglycan-associated protein
MKVTAMKTMSSSLLVSATALIANLALAAGPLVVGSGEKVDAQAVAKILQSNAFVTRSIRDDPPSSVALRIPFAFGSSKVPESAMSQLEAMSQAIKQARARVVIEGHTDSVGNPDYNVRLSQKRASAVRDVLVSSYGVDRNELKVVGMGEARPLPDLEPTSGENRRVEFRADR